MRITGVRCQVVKWYHKFFLGKQSGCILQNFKLKMFFSEFVARVFATYYTVNMLQPRFNGNFPSCCNVVNCQMLNYLFQHLIPMDKARTQSAIQGLERWPTWMEVHICEQVWRRSNWWSVRCDLDNGVAYAKPIFCHIIGNVITPVQTSRMLRKPLEFYKFLERT